MWVAFPSYGKACAQVLHVCASATCYHVCPAFFGASHDMFILVSSWRPSAEHGHQYRLVSIVT